LDLYEPGRVATFVRVMGFGEMFVRGPDDAVIGSGCYTEDSVQVARWGHTYPSLLLNTVQVSRSGLSSSPTTQGVKSERMFAYINLGEHSDACPRRNY
jgi:hypothetical protein